MGPGGRPPCWLPSGRLARASRCLEAARRSRSSSELVSSPRPPCTSLASGGPVAVCRPQGLRRPLSFAPVRSAKPALSAARPASLLRPREPAGAFGLPRRGLGISSPPEVAQPAELGPRANPGSEPPRPPAMPFTAWVRKARTAGGLGAGQPRRSACCPRRGGRHLPAGAASGPAWWVGMVEGLRGLHSRPRSVTRSLSTVISTDCARQSSGPRRGCSRTLSQATGRKIGAELQVSRSTFLPHPQVELSPVLSILQNINAP